MAPREAITVHKPKTVAAGVPAVLVSLRRSLTQMGAVRTVRTLAKVNQRDGFDCPRSTTLPCCK